MYRIFKNSDCGVEILPDITDTPIWDDYNPDINNANKTVRVIAALYIAIQKRENYYQLYSPTAHGDPLFSAYQGEVKGILKAMDWEEDTTDKTITIRKNKRKILVMDKVQKPQSYYNDKNEIAKLYREMGL